LLEYTEVNSTQNIARELVRQGDTAIIGVRADFQRRGRGRNGADWAALSGTCLLASYILPLPGGPETAGILALASGIAVADAVDQFTGLRAGLKWPNDVLVAGKKIAGILIETERSPQGNWWAVVGIGLNINVDRFPKELQSAATSLSILGGTQLEIETVEREVRSRLVSVVGLLAEHGSEPVIQAWRERDITIGMEFQISEGEMRGEGTAKGISDSGALILALQNGQRIEVFSATSLK
jgi:BirA family biotin operon repressor/biotin-[acetyl-CoA-carboxylase] ligase